MNIEVLNEYFPELDCGELINKKVYVWGIGVFGISVLRFLQECGVEVRGAIDMRAEEYRNILSVPVYTSDEIDVIDTDNSIIIITATKPQSISKMIQILKSKGGYEYIILNDKYTVQIDISGVCNLRCKSCPVANTPLDVFNPSGRKFMLPEVFEKIIIKLKREIKGIRCINLYIYGDPMLSPYLPEILDILKKYRLFSIISTNLSMNVDIDEILKHNPSCIKISTSGYTNEIYQTTHNNGNIKLVKSNMHRISWLIEQHKLSTSVIVGYHVYNNNGGYEYDKIKELCAELGFLLQPTQAVYFNNLKKMGIIPFDNKDIEFINTYYDDGKEILSVKEPDYSKPISCGLLSNGLFIDWNGDVELCCSIRKDDAILPFSYLDTPLSVIQKERYNHYICKECIAHNLEWC